jgi:DNA-binding MarR family transcriptional regulator
VHQPVRFSLLAALSRADDVEFRFLREALGVSDSALSRQITLLEEAGYVSVRKGHVGRRPRTWLSITTAGRTSFEDHVKVLREIVG